MNNVGFLSVLFEVLRIENENHWHAHKNICMHNVWYRIKLNIIARRLICSHQIDRRHFIARRSACVYVYVCTCAHKTGPGFHVETNS